MHDRQVTLPALALRVPIVALALAGDRRQDGLLGQQAGDGSVVVHHGVVASLKLGKELDQLLPLGPFGNIGAGGQGEGNGGDRSGFRRGGWNRCEGGGVDNPLSPAVGSADNYGLW